MSWFTRNKWEIIVIAVGALVFAVPLLALKYIEHIGMEIQHEFIETVVGISLCGLPVMLAGLMLISKET